MKISTEEEFEETLVQTVDFSKIILPIALQNLILENVGTPKLETAIDTLIKSRENRPFEKFMLTFLKCDLSTGYIKGVLDQYIRAEKSKDILKLALMKLTFYYQSRFFGYNLQMDKDLIDLITDIVIKLNSQRYAQTIKASIAKSIKNQLDTQKKQIDL